MPQVLLLHNTPTRSLLAHFSKKSDPGSRTITDMNLDGRVVIVTGATKGVGRGVGRELARHGARVFVTGRSAPDRERLDERITGIRCDYRVDVQAEAAFNLIVRETSTIDILVNNVWGGYERMIEDSNFTWSKPFWEQPMWRWDARRKIVWKCNHD
jgi:NAD(P)-dependent dehydrogenase (short-subunit alcohol dehydrogenase family)